MMNSDGKVLSFYERLHMRHRRWRYAFKSEKPSLAFLKSLPLDGRTLIDVGANWGVYTWIMSECAGRQGRVFSFEPQPELNAHLRSMKQSFGLSNVTIAGEGLSSAPATLQLQRPKVGSGEAGVNLPAETFGDVIDVRVTTLDLYLSDTAHSKVGFIKADVQGHEFDVFKGAEQTIARDQPVLLFELFDHEADRGDIFDLLSALGYEGWFFQVDPADHKSLRRNGRGAFVEFGEYKERENCREGVDFRNYFFAHKDSTVCSEIRKITGRKLRTAALGPRPQR